MKKLERTALVPFSAEKMFALVYDVEKYPQFMNGCKNATVLERTDSEIMARLELEQAGIRQQLTTRNQVDYGKRMSLKMVEGPFKHFEGLWKFEDLDGKACKISFQLAYQFANPILGLAAGKLMQHLANDQVDAICARAKALYGGSQ